MSRFLILVAVMVALDVFAPVVRAQDYVVNGHSASKAEAQLLTSYRAQPGRWVVDGYGISMAADGHPVQPGAQTGHPKCWYVLDVKLCD
jgi:hypothetical protein